ncbi:MAG: hypothetical protein SA339_08415 [Methanomassiliicoccus sp.]|nr:hypothetical protein [Methanomassiliicoccus sp.]
MSPRIPNPKYMTEQHKGVIIKECLKSPNRLIWVKRYRRNVRMVRGFLPLRAKMELEISGNRVVVDQAGHVVLNPQGQQFLEGF